MLRRILMVVIRIGALSLHRRTRLLAVLLAGEISYLTF